MSLVGLNVAFDDAGTDLQPTNHSESYDDDDDDDEDEDQCAHPCVTPKGPAEMLFLCGLPTDTISAAALAQQIHVSQSHRSSSGRSFATDGDDFATAVDSVTSDMMVFSPALTTSTSINDVSPSSSNSPFAGSSNDSDTSYQHTMFHRDVLTHQSYTTTPIIHQGQEEVFQDSKMTTTPTKKFFPTEAPQHVDAAEKVYDTAKNVWAWGKGVGVIKPLLSIAESLAGKVVAGTGNTLEGVDGIVIDQLHGIDDNFLNPAIAALVGMLLGAAGKSEDVLKPLLLPLLFQLKLIKDDGADSTAIPAAVATPKKETPEITPDIVAQVTPIVAE